jgi:hypothetical protein
MRYLKLIVLFSFLISTAVYAQSDFSGDDLSGKYSCAGKDHREGEYKGTVTMKLIPQHSVGKFAAYEFVLEVPGYGKYLGHFLLKLWARIIMIYLLIDGYEYYGLLLKF